MASWIWSMCLWPLCFMVTCQGFCARGRNLLQTSTAVFCWTFRPQVKGLLAGAVNCFLLLRANIHTHRGTQCTCTSGRAHIAGCTNTSAQHRALSCQLMPRLKWGVVHFGFNCVVLCISPGLIMGLYRVWVDEDACRKQ